MSNARYSEEECLEALAIAVEHYGEGPTQEEYNALGIRPTASLISDRVGSWGLALSKVGSEKAVRRETAKERCLNAIRNLADDLGGEPTTSDYRESSYRPSISTIYAHYGTWEDAKEEAGVIEKDERPANEEVEEYFGYLDEAETPEG